MGKLLSKIFGNKEMRILMLGLDAAGKTSILSSLLYFHFQIVICKLIWLSDDISFISLSCMLKIILKNIK